MKALEDNTPPKPFPYNRTDEIITECFKLKCNEFWTDYEIKERLVKKYGYTTSTAQKYMGKTWVKIKESVNLDYEETLAAIVNWMQNSTNPH